MSINIKCKEPRNVSKGMKTEFNITLTKRITCVVGDSGTGKTQLCNILSILLGGLNSTRPREQYICKEYETFGEIIKITENDKCMAMGEVAIINIDNNYMLIGKFEDNVKHRRLVIIDNAMDIIDEDIAKIIAEDKNTNYLIMGRSDLCDYLENDNYAELVRNGAEVRLVYTGKGRR